MADNPSSPEGAIPSSEEKPPALPTSEVEKKSSGARVMVTLSSVAKTVPAQLPGEKPLVAPAPLKPPAPAVLRQPISLPKQAGSARANKITMSISPKKGVETQSIPKITIPVPAATETPAGAVPPPLPVKTESEAWKTSQLPLSAPSVISPDEPGQKHDYQGWKNLKANVPSADALQSLETFQSTQEATAQNRPPPLNPWKLPLEENKAPVTASLPSSLMEKAAVPAALESPDKPFSIPPPLPASKPVAAPVAPVVATTVTAPPSLGGKTSAKKVAASDLPTLASELPAKTPPPLIAPSAPSATASSVVPVTSFSSAPAASPPPFVAVEPKHVVPAPLAGVIASHVPGAVPPLLVEKEKDVEVTPAHKLAPPQLPPSAPREEAPPLIQVKAPVSADGEPVKLALPGGKGLKGKVLEILTAKQVEAASAPAPVLSGPLKSPPAAPVKAPKKAASFFDRHIKSKSPAPAAPVEASLAAAEEKTSVLASPSAGSKPPSLPPLAKSAPLTRAERMRRKHLIEGAIFYGIFALVITALYFCSLYFGRETSIQAQVIPPPGTKLSNEAWLVNDFRELASGVADDVARDRAPMLLKIQERQVHVQRAQADIASREERIRLLQEQMQATRDDINATIKQARDDAQKIWDGPGAALENEYNARLNDLQKAIADRAKSLNLKYQPDDSYRSPEVWANAYRLALYQTPPGVDGVKEHQWLETEIKGWRDFTKTVDDRQAKLREQAAQIQLSPTTKVADANTKIDDLQHRIDGLQAEEDPLKAELQEAQTDLAEAQAAESGLDDKYYKQLYSVPEPNVIKRLPLRPNGRFSYEHIERDNIFAMGETVHHYWVFLRATRDDGRQYWVMQHLNVSKNDANILIVEPDSFISTKALLRPDLSPEDQKL